MKYPYLTVSPPPRRGRFLKRPAVEMEVFGPDRSVKVLAVVDSGADRSLFNSEIAKAVGIDINAAAKDKVTGITGQQEIYNLWQSTAAVRPRVNASPERAAGERRRLYRPRRAACWYKR